jgi:O-antigen/teichoic acid export membrane protein
VIHRGARDWGGIVWRLALTFGFQGQTLVCKALLLFVLARHLPPEDFGVFTLLVTTLTLALYAVGLEFSTFSAREILRRDRAEVSGLVRDQLVMHLLSYAVVGPLLLLVFVAGLLPWGVLGWFLPLLVVDHLGQEAQRLLVTLQRPAAAACQLFVRQGVWVYALLVLAWAAPWTISLNVVLGCWLVGEMAGLLLGAYFLRGIPWRPGLERPVDWPWLRRGLTVALPFAGSTLAFLAAASLDRYAVRHFAGAEAVGVYGFYLSVQGAIQSLLGGGLVSVYQARIVLVGQRGQLGESRRLLWQLAAGVVLGWTVLAALAALLIGPVIRLVGRPVYAEHLDAFWLVLLIPPVQVLASLVQLALYARHLDRPIFCSSGVALVAAAVFNAVLVPAFGLPGAAVATLGALAVAGAVAWLFLRSIGVPCALPSS